LRDQLKSEFEGVIERRRINIQAKIEELQLQIGSIIISKATPEKSLSKDKRSKSSVLPTLSNFD